MADEGGRRAWDGKPDRRSENPWVSVIHDELSKINDRLERIEEAEIDKPTLEAIKQMAMFWNGSRLMSRLIIGVSAMGAAIGVIGGGLIWAIQLLKRM